MNDMDRAKQAYLNSKKFSKLVDEADARNANRIVDLAEQGKIDDGFAVTLLSMCGWAEEIDGIEIVDETDGKDKFLVACADIDGIITIVVLEVDDDEFGFPLNFLVYTSEESWQDSLSMLQDIASNWLAAVTDSGTPVPAIQWGVKRMRPVEPDEDLYRRLEIPADGKLRHGVIEMRPAGWVG